jgi:hypothetical protein
LHSPAFVATARESNASFGRRGDLSMTNIAYGPGNCCGAMRYSYRSASIGSRFAAFHAG